jgi:hypothetical protein
MINQREERDDHDLLCIGLWTKFFDLFILTKGHNWKWLESYKIICFQ